MRHKADMQPLCKKNRPFSQRGEALLGVVLGLGAIMLLYAWLVVMLADRTIYFLMDARSWEAHRNARCTEQRRRYFFGDLRAGSVDESRPLELSCEQAIAVPATQSWLRNRRGQRLNMLRYGSQATTDPILLYIPGVSANYLAGTRYIPMARRLGFELVIIEMSNHGSSDSDGTGAAYGCREKDDITAMLTELQRTDPQRPILLFSSSMSAMAVVNAAPELKRFQRVKAIVLENAPSSLRGMITVFAHKLHLPAFLEEQVYGLIEQRTGFRYADCALPPLAAQLSVPSFVAIAEHDIMVPVAMAYEVFQALPRHFPHLLKVYSHGDHSAVWNGQPEHFEADLKAFWEASLNFAASDSQRPPH